MTFIYTSFAGFYDVLMADMDYAAWADYIEEIFKKERLKPRMILDLGCGTGSFCIEMAARGYEMIGLDSSVDMLSKARQKTLEKGLDILFLNQEMPSFELYGTVDAVVCLLDSINYITRKNDLLRTFKLVRNYLNPGGVFIFDINTYYKLSAVLGSNVFYSVDDEVSYIWQNSFNRSNNTCEFDLTFFAGEGDLYRKFDEVHVERAYSIKEICGLLKRAGLNFQAVYDELSFRPPKKRSQRIFFTCKK